ncbi:MAG: hypothetical protein JO345_19095 [Streptosporangiaceae bacterium]|nr:hypothetical protein [Streptosporangiaceae bacterium]
MNDALLELLYDDPLDAWRDIPVLELSGPLDGRLDAVLAALDQSRLPRLPGLDARVITDRALPLMRYLRGTLRQPPPPEGYRAPTIP